MGACGDAAVVVAVANWADYEGVGAVRAVIAEVRGAIAEVAVAKAVAVVAAMVVMAVGGGLHRSRNPLHARARTHTVNIHSTRLPTRPPPQHRAFVRSSWPRARTTSAARAVGWLVAGIAPPLTQSRGGIVRVNRSACMRRWPRKWWFRRRRRRQRMPSWFPCVLMPADGAQVAACHATGNAHNDCTRGRRGGTLTQQLHAIDEPGSVWELVHFDPCAHGIGHNADSYSPNHTAAARLPARREADRVELPVPHAGWVMSRRSSR